MAPSGGLPHLAGATDLERWADRRSAQADLPTLIRRLIRAENDQVQRVEMRSGEGVQSPGYDGIVESTRSTSFVPEGHSVWEMGVGRDPEDKAQKDYRARTDNSLGVDKTQTTFVFVTPRRWDKKKDWEQRRREEGIWRDVRALDADDIEQALEVSSAVRIWLSELLEMEPLGATSVEDWWTRFSRGFNPLLTPDVVLAGREDYAATLVDRLQADVGRTFVRAASIDDGLAFATCAMMAAGDSAEVLLSRSLLVHDGVALRRLDRTSNLLILLPYEESLQRDAHLIENHHVVFVVTDSEGDVDVPLPPLDHLALRAALAAAAVPTEEIDRYARAGNKSLLALRRASGPFRSQGPENWTRGLSNAALRRLWLVGAWSQKRTGDVEVIESLTTETADEIVDKLQRETHFADPLFARVGATWTVTAHRDSWSTARSLITSADLDSLEHAIQTVLGAIDPSLDLAPEDRWLAGVHGKVRVHSSDLRKGLSRTLALLGTHGDQLRLSGGRTAKEWSEVVTWKILNRANSSPMFALWESIVDVAPLLAEAAPDVFLRELSQAITSPDFHARALFQDSQEHWNVSSPHTGILWALEGLAWSEPHFGYVAEILAQLAEIDPGGRLSNRPMATLSSLFRAGAAQTSVPASTRIQTLDALLHRHQRIAGELLLKLLPGNQEWVMANRRPEYRDWAAAVDQTRVDLADLQLIADAVAVRAISLAETDLTYIPSVVARFGEIPTRYRVQLLDVLETVSDIDMDFEVRSALWEAIEGLVRHHRQYSEATWALSEDWLMRLSRAGEILRPSSPQRTHRWLFDSWDPDIGTPIARNMDKFTSDLNQRRAEAIRETLTIEGLPAVLSLASQVQLPWTVGSALAEVHRDGDDNAVLPLLEGPESALVQLADGYARARFRGDTDKVESWVERYNDRPLLQARLLQTVHDLSSAWTVLERMGQDVSNAYWSEFVPYGRGSHFAMLVDSASALIDHGRAAAAVHALSIYSEQLASSDNSDVIVRALAEFGTTEDPEARQVSSFDIDRLMSILRRGAVDESTIAGFEWKYFPLLRGEHGTPTLEKRLSEHPASFVQLIELAFKSDGDEQEEGDANPTESAIASNAYGLLREWRVVPGTQEDGTIDATRLNAWLQEVRELLEQSHRLEIGELQIGEVLAHSPQDKDGTFPALPVREALEASPNDRLERGFTIGLFNLRGVTSRGLTEGGQQEYDLASTYDNWASAVHSTHPRTAAALREMAATYKQEGRRNDEEVSRFLEGLDR